ncbi:MAG: alpha-(1-_3)-arabinofuranosyltransferase family protein [Patescibacteria group bacterium]
MTVKNKISANSFFLAAVLLAFIPLLWFRPWDTLITNGDFWLPLNPLNTLRQLSSSWLENISGGQINSLSFHIIPWVGFWALFKFFSLSLSTIEKMWFVSVFLLGAVSMYFLTKEIFENKRGSWRNFLPSVLYLFNLYIMINGFVTTNLLAYMMMPLLLLIYMKGIKGKDSFKFAFFLSLATVFMASAAGNPPIYSIPFLLLAFFFVYSLFFRRQYPFSWKFNFEFIILYLLFNAWWLYPFLTSLLSQAGTIQGITAAATVGATSKFIDLVRLLGSWAFFAGHMGFPYFPFAKSYLNPVLATLTFLVPSLCVLGFVFRVKKGKSAVTFFALLALVGIVFSHGQAGDIFGRLNALIHRVVPFFWIYREPFAKFTALTAFSYAILLGSLFSYLENRLKSRLLLNILGVAATALVLTVAWPLLNGDHYPGTRGVLGSSRTKIQPYWFEMSKWFAGKEREGRVLVLPENPDYLHSGIPYAWGYDSTDITPFFLSAPWIERNNGAYPVTALSDRVSALVYNRLHGFSRSPDNISGLLSLLNVSRILQRNDVDLRRINSQPERYSPEYLRRVLEAQKDIALENSFGLLDVYSLNKEQRWDRIYVPNEIDCLGGNAQALNYFPDFAAPGSVPVIFSQPSGNTAVNGDGCHENVIVPVKFTRKGQTFETGPIIFVPGGDFKTAVYPVTDVLGAAALNGDDNHYYLPVSTSGTYRLLGERADSPVGGGSSPVFNIRNIQTNETVAGALVEGLSFSPDLDYIGSYNLNPGSYVFKVSASGLPNLLKEGSESGLWKSSLTGVVTPLSGDSYAGEKSLGLGRGLTDAFYSFPLDKIGGGYYELSFFNKVNSGAPPAVIIWENNCDIDQPVWVKSGGSGEDPCSSTFLVQPTMTASADWSEYSVDYKLNPKAKKAGVVFAFLDAPGNIYTNSGETLINNVALRIKFYRGFVLENRSGKTLLNRPEIKIAQRSATKYSVAVRNATAPFYLVFSENFSEDWQASVANSGIIGEDKHFLANGYANSWYLEKTGDYQIEVSYLPETWFRFFSAVSLISITIGLLLLFVI